MFDTDQRLTVADLEGLLPLLAGLAPIADCDVSGAAHVSDASHPTTRLAGQVSMSDVERIDLLSVLERVKAAVAGVQVRVTAAFVDSQEQIAQEWTARAGECSDAGDFEGWRAARDQARLASFDVDAGRDGDAGWSAGHGRGSGGSGSRRSRRPGAGLGVAGQVGLARGVSPSRGARCVREALVLVRDMPAVLAALEAGALSEWRAGLVVAETTILSPADRRLVDEELAATLGVDGAHPVGGGLSMLGDRELVRQVKAVAYRVDAACVLARSRKAVAERRVTIRPAPDTMSYVTALLPVAQGVAVHAALTAAAASARAGGDGRGKGQLMADTLVCRVTGQETAAAVPVEVQVVITDRSLLAATGPGSDVPAQVPGYGTVPAGWARDLLTAGVPADTSHGAAGSVAESVGKSVVDPVADRASDGVAGQARVWLRRLYTHPVDGTLVAMDSTRRTFNGGLRRYLIGRDGTCRTPWCDAPIRHLDHITDHAGGGPTTATNAQGLCVACNHTKQLPGWHARTVTADLDVGTGLDPNDEPQLELELEPDRRHTVELTTPTGHRYRSTAPPVIPGLPIHGAAADESSPLETPPRTTPRRRLTQQSHARRSAVNVWQPDQQWARHCVWAPVGCLRGLVARTFVLNQCAARDSNPDPNDLGVRIVAVGSFRAERPVPQRKRDCSVMWTSAKS